MKNPLFLFACLFLCTATLMAQSVHSAVTDRRLSLNVGVEASTAVPFNPTYSESSTGVNYWNSHHDLYGGGVYADLRLTRRVSLEAEGRILQSEKTVAHGFSNAHAWGEDTFLVGPRVTVLRKGKFEPYAKGLVGAALSTGNATFGSFSGARGVLWGDKSFYFAYAAGGGVDYHLNRHYTIRLFDAEWQGWNQTLATTLVKGKDIMIHPMTASIGISYRIR